jgi:urease accessory protein
MGPQARGQLHPPLEGEGRTAEGSPGWGDATSPQLLHRRHPHPARKSGPTSPLQGEVERATFAANRAHGRVSLAVAATPLGTRCTTIHEEGSLRVRFPNARAGPTEAVLVNTAGGFTGGDRFAVSLTLDAGAHLTVTTVAAEKIYRSLGPDACVDVSATLADDAELTWLPQETILFDRARLARTITITLASRAKLVLAETIVFGRSAMGETVHEGGIIDRWRIRRDGRLIFAENFRLDGAIADRLNEAAVARSCTAIGTVLMAPGEDIAVAAARAASEQFRGEVGISAWNGIALARLAARDGAALRHDLVVLLSALGRPALPRIWLN